MRIPDELLNEMKQYCTEKNIGVVHIYSEAFGVTVILAGSRDMPAEHASVVAAHMLLHGVVTQGLQQAIESQTVDPDATLN